VPNIDKFFTNEKDLDDELKTLFPSDYCILGKTEEEILKNHEPIYYSTLKIFRYFDKIIGYPFL